ncbi:MAG: N-formylglutamate deformylase [Achromobacter sp.]|uniref:N-formylglutamate deformylase n=1 Tax=Achromobacter sp. TaxID=134375 RepID=UPI003D01069A
MNPPIVTLTQGHLPLLVSIPHGGECLPEPFLSRMTPAAHKIADTDWHLARLYDFARAMGASVLQANYSRYIIDVNRPADGASLYPGTATTGLCPTESFLGEALYQAGSAPPDEQETAERIVRYWQPYHDALRQELSRLRQKHAHVLLWEAHSIANELPRLFEGRLPDLNIGTFSGAACAPALREAAVAAASASPFSWVADARFKGGYITRNYGRPQSGVHAVQLEMSRHLYMVEGEPYAYREDRAAAVLPTVERMVGNTLRALEGLQ